MAAKLSIVLCVAFSVLAVSLGDPYPYQRRQKENKHGLTIDESTKNKLKGEYHGFLGHIRFSSETSHRVNSLSITSPEGIPIFILKRPRSSPFMTMTTRNKKFLSTMNEPKSGFRKYSDYVVPHSFHKLVETASMQSDMPNAVMQLFELEAKSMNVNATRQKEIEDIIARGEADLIVEAAKALGRAGVMGYESPAALQFYALAMRLDKTKDRMQTQIETYGTARAQAYRRMSLLRSLIQSQPSGSTQNANSCPQEGCTTANCPDQNNECNGMCGRKCSCWSWVCGDCCVHQGCLIHDNCCAEHGYLSTACLNVVGLTCTSYSC